MCVCDISSLRVNGPSEPGRLRDVCVCQWVKNKRDQLVDTNKIPPVHTKQMTHLRSGNQTDMELRNRNVRLCQQVQHSRHAEIQSRILKAITNTPWYVTNHTVHTDFNITYVSDVIHERINKNHNNLEAHLNPLL